MSKRLGKGLEALLGVALADKEKTAPAKAETATGLLELEIKQLEPGRYQPRMAIQNTDLQSLADSIRTQGIIQPILVRQKSRDRYEIIAGERRWRAAQIVGLQKVPVVVKELSDERTLAIALIENIQRQDLTPLEEAHALERLSKEFVLTHQQVADAVGKSRVAITHLLRLLTLPDEVKKLIDEQKLEMGHAKVLMGLRTQLQIKLAKTIAEQGLSVREAERLVGRTQEESETNSSSLVTATTTKMRHAKAKDPDVRRLEISLSDKLGAFVEIVQAEKGKGRLMIRYNSLEELDGILSHIL